MVSDNKLNKINHPIKKPINTNITYTKSGNDARRITANNEFDLIIINTPLKDEFGHDLAIYAAEKYDSTVILICKSDISEELSEKLSYYGIFVVNKPIDNTKLSQAMYFISSSALIIPEYNKNFKVRTDELKLINRAKNCLMHYFEFSESQAHKYIEKQAMNNRKTRKETAKEIILMYDF